MEKTKKLGGADALMADAALIARRSIEAQGLTPGTGDYGELVYEPQQAYQAACHTREDAITLIHLQVSGLRMLSQVKAISVVCLVVLLYIAYRVS